MYVCSQGGEGGQKYLKMCLHNIWMGPLDDEPPPRLPVNSVKSHVAPALDLIISDCKLQKFTSEENDLESTAYGLFDKLEAMHGTSFKTQNGE